MMFRIISTLLVLASFSAFGRDEIARARLPIDERFWSKNGQYFFVYQGDGNLVVYTRNEQPIWASNSHNQGGTFCEMQGDGNLVIYANSRPIWSTGTHGSTKGYYHSDTKLVMQDDGNMVLLWQTPRTVVPLWSSKGGKWSEKEIIDFVEARGGFKPIDVPPPPPCRATGYATIRSVASRNSLRLYIYKFPIGAGGGNFCRNATLVKVLGIGETYRISVGKNEALSYGVYTYDCSANNRVSEGVVTYCDLNGQIINVGLSY